MFLENCQDIVLDKMREIVAILKQFSNSSDRKIRNYVGKCWYTVVHLDKVYMTEYYEDLITRSYMLETDCQIYVKPIFTDSYTYGYHNIII